MNFLKIFVAVMVALAFFVILTPWQWVEKMFVVGAIPFFLVLVVIGIVVSMGVGIVAAGKKLGTGGEKLEFYSGLFIKEVEGALFHLMKPDQVGVFINRFTAGKGYNEGWHTSGFLHLGRLMLSIPYLWEMVAILDLSQEQLNLTFEINPGGEKMKVSCLVVVKITAPNGTIDVEVARQLLTELDAEPKEFITDRAKSAYNTALASAVLGDQKGVKSSADMIPDNFAAIDAAAKAQLQTLISRVGFQCESFMTQGVSEAAVEKAKEQVQVWKALSEIKDTSGTSALEKANPNVLTIMQGLLGLDLGRLFSRGKGKKQKGSEEDED